MAATGRDPLDPVTANRRIRTILHSGTVRFSGHALDEMQQDQLTTVDCVSVLRGGVVQPPELERGSWRYGVLTNRICVVVAFRSSDELVIVTAWRSQTR